MFGFGKKHTELEKFCNDITADNVARSADDTDQNNATMGALLLFLQSGRFLSQINKSKHLKRYVKRVNPDLVIIESMIFMYARLKYLVEAKSDYEYDMMDVLSLSIEVALSSAEKKSNITGTEKLLRSRDYVSDIGSATETFSLILEHSCFESEPTIKLNIDLKRADIETYTGIRFFTKAFVQHNVDPSYEIIAEVVEEYVAREWE